MRFKSRFEADEFVILAEMEPPKGVDVSEMLAHATRVKGEVDAFVVPEMSNAVMRMSSLGASLLLQSKGMETIMQICCRDRNRLAIQADLLAAGANGIPAVMAVNGEDPSYGDHHQAKPVYDIDSLELLEVIRGMAAGRDMAGVELSGAPDFLVGSAVNAGQSGESLEKELEKIERQVAAGARFFITQPLFETGSIKPFLDRIDSGKAAFIPTVLLLKSVGMARYIERNLKHIHIPSETISRLQKSPDRVRECIDIAAETISNLKAEGFRGVLISTLGWEKQLPDILERI